MEGEKERQRGTERGTEREAERGTERERMGRVRWKTLQNREDKRKTERRGKCSERAMDRYIYRNKVKGSKDLIQLFYVNDLFFRVICCVVFAISISLIIS